MTSVAIVLFTIGIVICQQILKCPAPSIFAVSQRIGGVGEDMKIEKVLLWENREDVVLVSYVLEENKEIIGSDRRHPCPNAKSTTG